MDLQSAKNHAKNGNYDEAIHILLSLHETDPHHGVVFLLGHVYLQKQEYDSALLYFQIHQTLKPEARVYQYLAEIYTATQNHTQSITMYNKALDIDPYNPIYLYKKAHCMEILKTVYENIEILKVYQESIKNIEILKSNHPKAPIIYYDYALFCINTQNNGCSLAQTILERALALIPDENLQNLYDYCLQETTEAKNKELQPYSLNPNKHHKIKLMLYNFDDIIFLNNNEFGPDMKWRDIQNSFGCRDRIEVLRSHFTTIQSDRKIVIISSIHQTIISNLMERVNLMCFFDGIHSIHSFAEAKEKEYATLDPDNICYIVRDFRNIDLERVSEFCRILAIKPYHHCILPGLKMIDLEYIEYTFHHITKTNIYYDDFPYEMPQSMIEYNETVYNAIKTEIETEHKVVNDLRVFKWIERTSEFSRYRSCYIEFCYKFGDISFAMKQKEYWRAANWIYQCLIMEENDYELHGQLAKCLSYLRLDMDADKHYRISMDLKNDSYSVHESFAYHLLNTRRNSEAIPHFERCLDLKRFDGGIKNAHFCSQYAKANDFCYDRERVSIAEEYYRLALEYDDKKNTRTTARFHGDFGAFLMKRRQMFDARSEYETAIALDGRNGYLHWKLSVVLWKMGLKEEHVEHLVKALNINDNLEGAKRDYFRYFKKEYGVNDEYKEDGRIVDDIRNYDTNNHNDMNRNRMNDEEYDKTTISTFNLSAASTTLSKYHPKDQWQNQFNRMYLDRLGKRNKTEKERVRFKGYLGEMIFHNLNDIRMVLNHDINVLMKQMKHKINIHDEEDLKKISALFQEIKNEHYVFKTFCDENGIDKISREEVLERNGVFRVEGIQSIKKQDLVSMINGSDETREYNTCKPLMDVLWNVISQIQQMRL